MKIRQLLSCVSLTVLFPTTSLAVTGMLETPDVTESGVSLIYGWHCTAKSIEIQVDDGPRIKAGSGTLRPDTASVCGRSDTGFGLTYNYNVLVAGDHTVSAYADGVLFDKRSLRTSNYGVEYLQGAGGASCTVEGFPSRGFVTTLTWSESKQNFATSQILKLTQPGRLVGNWAGTARTSVAEPDMSCTYRDLPTGPSMLDEGQATVDLALAANDVAVLNIRTPHGKCVLTGPWTSATSFSPDAALSDLSCLFRADATSLVVQVQQLLGSWPWNSDAFVAMLSIQSFAPGASANCPVHQWITFHGARPPG